MKRWKHRYEFWFTAALFFVVTIPFRRLFSILSVTEVRPVSAFPPVFGLLLGFPGALGCAVGNLAADLLSGYSLPLCGAGFIAQFLYGYLPYLLWYGRKGRRQGDTLHFNSLCQVLKYIGIIFADAVYMAVALGALTQLFGISSFFSESTLLLFFNNLVFPLILGIPMIIAARLAAGRSRGGVLSLNVRFVLIFLLFSVVSAVLAGFFAYRELAGQVAERLFLWNRIYTYIAADFFVLCAMALLVLWYLERNITIPIEQLTQIAQKYAEGKEARERTDSAGMILQCEALGRLHGEPGRLAGAFGGMMREVEHYIADITCITAEKERIRTELQVAAKLQADMLPDPLRLQEGCDEFRIHAAMKPAKEVGGDFYDIFLTDEDHLVFLVADVSGKGVPAALFMVISKTLLHSLTEAANDPEQAFAAANEALCRDNQEGMFVTAWMGVLTLSTGELIYVNAGHNRPLLKRSGESCFFVSGRRGFVLAGMEGTRYRQERLRLQPGDTLFLYTDGVTEANNIRQELYGDDRLKLAIDREEGGKPQELIGAVREDIRSFQGPAEQFDDITMLAMQYRGDGFQKNRGAAVLSRQPEILAFVDSLLEKEEISRKTCCEIRVAADEIFTNICRYSKAREVTAGAKVIRKGSGPAVLLYFEDDGVPFNPLEQKKPDTTGGPDRREEGGLGIYLVRRLMDEVWYGLLDGKNRLTVLKRQEEGRQEKWK